MSGFYVLLFVMDKECVKELRGFILVVLGVVVMYIEEQLKGFDFFILIVYGENDVGFK